MVHGREGASEDTRQGDSSIARNDRKKDLGDGRSGLSAATGAGDARTAGVASIASVRRRRLPAAVRAEKAVRRHERGEADKDERRQNASHPLTFTRQHTRVRRSRGGTRRQAALTPTMSRPVLLS